MSYESKDKMVSHPSHYQSGKYEVIDIIDEFTKDLSGAEAVCTANTIKYILRWKKKNGIQDIKKAIWYLTHLVEHLEGPMSFEDAVDQLKTETDNAILQLYNDSKAGEKLEPGCDKCEISECRFLKDPFMNPPYDQLWKDYKQLEKKYKNMTDYAEDMENNYCEAEQKIEELEEKNQKLWDICGRLKNDNEELEDENLQLKADYQNLEDKSVERSDPAWLYETEAPCDICGNCKHFNDKGRCTFDMHFPEKDYWDDACKYFFAKPDMKVVIKQEVTKKETE